MTALEAVVIMAQLLSIGAAIDAAEILATRVEYAEGGIYAWSLMRTNNRWSTAGLLSGALDRLFSPRGFAIMMIVQLAVAAGVVTTLALPVLPFAVFALFCLRVATNVRHQYGLDGGDQMNAIVLGALVLWFLAPTAFAKETAIWFIAFQSAISYFTAGIAKAVSRVWRSGAAIRGILNTRSYGNRVAVAVIERVSVLSLATCWFVIVFECSFPLVFVVPQAVLVYVAIGIAFHVGIAAMMGLNNFIWPFVATYPAVYLTAADVSGALRSWPVAALHVR